MKKGSDLPTCKEKDLVMEQFVELWHKGCGCLLVVDEKNHLLGTFMDGKLRRALKNYGEAIFKMTVGELCNKYATTHKCLAGLNFHDGSLE
jgi:arabinose-5-phosphate isomerase